MKAKLVLAAMMLLAVPVAAAPAVKADKPGKVAPEAKVDQREARQTRRIEMGIKKGALTEEETTALDATEKSIQDLEGTLKGEGKLTKAEAKQLEQALNAASLQIWAQKHDTEGTQLPAKRLGKDIFADDDLTAKIESGSLTKAEAKTFVHDFKEMVHIKKRLATEELTPAERTELQEKFNALLSLYFHQK
jgi:polyhydroxyalkanoate synthesis regulator phasin